MVKLSLRLLAATLLAGAVVLPPPEPAAAKDCGGSVECACGDRVVASTTLAGDLNNCLGDGLIVAGGVVDCAGRQIAGPGDRTATVGILVRGFTAAGATGAEVRNCRIRNFGRGVEIDSGSANVVTNSAIFANEVGVWVGDGATGTRIEDNHVRDNRDEGIHVGGGVTACTIARNTLTSNRSENLYLIGTSGNRVEANVIEDSNTAAILLKHADDNVLTGNSVLDRNVLVRGDSSGNLFADNDVASGFFHFEAVEDAGVWTYPHDNQVVGGVVRKAGTCFEFSGAYANSVADTLVDTCQAKQEKPRGGLEPYDNVVDVLRMDPGEHSTAGRRRAGSLRMGQSSSEDGRFTVDLRTFSPPSEIDPLNEDVRCVLADWSGTIFDVDVPGGWLRQRGQTRGGRFVDRSGARGGLRRLEVRPLKDGTWRMKLTGRTDASGAEFPIMTLTCTIGDDVLAYNDFWTRTARGWNLRLR